MNQDFLTKPEKCHELREWSQFKSVSEIEL